jgi:hypothetical protein
MREEDTVVAFCTGCGSTIPDHLAEKDPFLQNGHTGICPFCKGPVIVTDASEVERLRERRQNGEVI